MHIRLFISLIVIFLLSSCASEIVNTKVLNLEKDKISGRFFYDQTDINNDYQFHVIYSLYSDSIDHQGDVNGDWEEWIKIADKYILKATKNASKSKDSQTFNWDYRSDGKLDVSFLRFPFTEKEMKQCRRSCRNIFGRTIIEAGFNNPKKIYLNFGDFKYKDWPYAAGYPIINIFTNNKGIKLTKKSFGYFVMHEGIHGMGGIFKCSPNEIEGHNTRKTSDLMSLQGDGTNNRLDPNNDDYYEHKIENCPDIKDSVFLSPISKTPYSPFEIACLPKNKWKVTDTRFDAERDWCFYSRNDISVPWEEKIGIIKR